MGDENGRTVVLGVRERVVLLNLLGGYRGSVVKLKIVRDLQNEVGFTDEEHQRLQFDESEDGGRVQWRDGIEPREFEIGPSAREVVVEILDDLSDRGEMSLAHLPLYERLVDEEAGSGR